MRVLVCGSRIFDDKDHLFETLDLLHEMYGFTQVIEGEARGADRLACLWAEDRGLPVRKYPADWKKYGKAAGPIRNKQMLEEGQPEIVVAFPFESLERSRGTKNMVAQARKAGVPVVIIEDGMLP